MPSDILDREYGTTQVPVQPMHPGGVQPEEHTRTLVDLSGYQLEFDAVAFTSGTEDILALRAAFVADGQAQSGAWQLVPESRAVMVTDLYNQAPVTLDGAGRWQYFHHAKSELLSLIQATPRDSAADFASTQVRNSEEDPTTVLVTTTGKIIVAKMAV
jgi:hypothetical protein